jgi:hypothetical protein
MVAVDNRRASATFRIAYAARKTFRSKRVVRREVIAVLAAYRSMRSASRRSWSFQEAISWIMAHGSTSG